MAFVFQVGEDKYGYQYKATQKKVNGTIIWQCCRPATDKTNTHCLWLYKSHDGHWIATEAETNAADPVNTGQPTFRTCEVVPDITASQYLNWHWFVPATREWKGSLGFLTYRIMLNGMPTSSSTTNAMILLGDSHSQPSTTMPVSSRDVEQSQADTADVEQSQAITAIPESQRE
jgi:hypothetical protein